MLLTSPDVALSRDFVLNESIVISGSLCLVLQFATALSTLGFQVVLLQHYSVAKSQVLGFSGWGLEDDFNCGNKQLDNPFLFYAGSF